MNRPWLPGSQAPHAGQESKRPQALPTQPNLPRGLLPLSERQVLHLEDQMPLTSSDGRLGHESPDQALQIQIPAPPLCSHGALAKLRRLSESHSSHLRYENNDRTYP